MSRVIDGMLVAGAGSEGVGPAPAPTPGPFRSDAEEITHLRRQRDDLQTHNTALLLRARAVESLPRVAVAVLVRRGEEILVFQRADGSWCHPGGKLAPDETIGGCAARELREETGIEIAPAAVRRLDLWSFERGPAGTFLLVWCAVKVPVETDARLAEPDKFRAWRWVTKEEGWPTPMFMGSATLAARADVDPWNLPENGPQ